MKDYALGCAFEEIVGLCFSPFSLVGKFFVYLFLQFLFPAFAKIIFVFIPSLSRVSMWRKRGRKKEENLKRKGSDVTRIQIFHDSDWLEESDVIPLFGLGLRLEIFQHSDWATASPAPLRTMDYQAS